MGYLRKTSASLPNRETSHGPVVPVFGLQSHVVPRTLFSDGMIGLWFVRNDRGNWVVPSRINRHHSRW